MRRLLDGERVTYAGEVFSVHDVALETPPPAPVPILLGVKGPRALALAAEVADGVHCSILDLAGARAPRARRRTVERAGRLHGRSRTCRWPLTTTARRRARWMRPLLARYLGALHGQSILADAGLGAARTQPFRDALAAGRAAADLVTDELMDAVAIAGTPAECRAALARWAEAGPRRA